MIKFPLFALFVCVVNLLVVIIALYPYTQPFHLKAPEGRGIGYPISQIDAFTHGIQLLMGRHHIYYLLLRVC